jgi:hypothetical protein
MIPIAALPSCCMRHVARVVKGALTHSRGLGVFGSARRKTADGLLYRKYDVDSDHDENIEGRKDGDSARSRRSGVLVGRDSTGNSLHDLPVPSKPWTTLCASGGASASNYAQPKSGSSLAVKFRVSTILILATTSRIDMLYRRRRTRRSEITGLSASIITPQ